MVSFEIFVKAMPPSLSELKVLPSFYFAFKIPDDRAVTITGTIKKVLSRNENGRIFLTVSVLHIKVKIL